MDAVPSNGSYLHGYLLNSGFSEEIRSWHSRHPSVPMHFFWDKKDQRAEVKIDDCLSFHQLDDTLFLRYMSGAKAYATTAGFESVCEAMYLNKPVLMVPTHIEQACNAYDALCLAQALSLIVLIWTCYYPFRKVMWRIRSSGIG